MRKQKSLFLMLLTVMILLGYSKRVYAAGTGEFEYSLSNGEAVIKQYKGNSTAIVIPSKIDGYTVKGIGEYVFKDNTKITSLEIKEGVRYIDNGAFYGCLSLRTVKIPASMEEIGDYSAIGAFRGCKNLNSLTIATGTKKAYIGASAFRECKSLTSVVIPGNYSEVWHNAFEECTSLKTVEYKDATSVVAEQKIFGNAFNGCLALQTVKFPNKLVSIGDKAFENCVRLASVTIPEGTTAIGAGAFKECKGLKTATLPSTLVELGTDNSYGVFQDCTSLATVTLKDGKQDAIIRWRAFLGCKALKTITIPGNYTTIGMFAFRDCTSLTSFSYKKSNYGYANQLIESYAFENCKSLTTISLTSSLETIGRDTFSKCVSLKSVSIPEGVKEIKEGAFEKCSALTTVTLPKTIIAIGGKYERGVFQECTSLTTVTMGAGTLDATLGHATFAYCSKLKSITVPGNYTSIGGSAFYNCTSLAKVVYEKSNADYANQMIDTYAFYNCTSLTSISIPTTVNTIAQYAFSYCTKLRQIRIPEGVQKIEQGVFYYCNGLVSVTIPSTTVEIGREYSTGAFEKCSSLTNVNIAEGTEELDIYGYTFGGSNNIKHVYLPQRTRSVSSYSFNQGVKPTIHGKNGFAKTYASKMKFPYSTAGVSYDVNITSIALNKNKVSLLIGKGQTLTYKVSPVINTNTFTWSSSNPSIATVSSNGYVTAKGVGTATISIKSNNGKVSTCIVTVGNSITYQLNGGKNHKNNKTFYYNEMVKFANPTRKGYVFKGWYTDNKYKSKITSISKGTRKNYTLYAKWEKVTVNKAVLHSLSNVKGSKMQVKVKPISGAKGYEVVYATQSNFRSSKTMDAKGNTTVTIAKLAKNKTYFVKVRAYKIDSEGKKVYGAFSPAKKVVIKK